MVDVPPVIGSEGSLRVGTWNMEKYPLAQSGKGPEAADFLAAARAELWLLTEVNARWQTPGQDLVASPRRTLGGAQERWAGIQTALPMVRLLDDGRTPAAAEESLCLARIQMRAGSFATTVLTACSVLPWGGAGDSWPNLPATDLDTQAEFVLDHHIERIRSARRPGEPLIWGGDFNQALRRPNPELQRAHHRTFGTVAGISRLETAFESLELQVLTASAGHCISGREAIDHLAVSRDISAIGDIEVLRPPARAGGQRLSDHAAYVADLDL
ncbi:hypothetical protein [Blastococcus sp. CCUG 61487]|uniref:hypothetical protein n=1 Tax=Blastococcus sp. CCUG 61487 TaxID=1840703 RepID=UPI0010C08D76|nr:hypothetical protein [Blastococcus sp. CCUG 61487]TKJ30284.1 hypothetical protein A6V29_18975 [Blastococcus sp. CCUG 61487]